MDIIEFSLFNTVVNNLIRGFTMFEKSLINLVKS